MNKTARPSGAARTVNPTAPIPSEANPAAAISTALNQRLSGYSRRSNLGAGTLAATAAAAWSLSQPQVAEAVVNTFTFSSPPVANSWNRTTGPTVASGTLGSNWRGKNSFVKVRVQAQGARLDYVGSTVAQSAVINTFNNYPNATDVTSTGAAALFPLRVSNGTVSYFGWLRITGGATRTVGFSDQPRMGVLAGTTTELAVVPEPTTALPLLLLGAAGLIANRRRRAAL